MKEILIFSDKQFPGYKNIFNTDDKCIFCNRENLAQELISNKYEIFINAHGEFFPAECIGELIGFLKKGNGFLNLGDVPLRFPVFEKEGPEYEKYREMRKLNIHTYANVDGENVEKIEKTYPFSETLIDEIFEKNNSKSLTWVATKTSYEEEIWGSVGPMDITVKSLVTGINSCNEKIISYASLIENRAGEYQGGRWILLTGKVKDSLDFSVLKNACEYVAHKSRRCTMIPSYACYKENEQPVIYLSMEQDGEIVSWNGTVNCYDEKEKLVHKQKVSLNDRLRIQKLDVLIEDCKKAGRYTVKLALEASDGEKIEVTQGFYISDGKPLNKLKSLKCKKDYFYKEDEVFIVNGTTYMADDVSRQFLLYPNPEHWYQDMKEMKRQGINWVRTGLWCNWRRYMWDDGKVDESVLRAFDAFLMAAQENDLYVTFNFFAFVPEAWEGTNPYLDERSLRAQENFIGAFVSRCKNYTGIDWDLINEPYVFDHPLTKKKATDKLEQLYFEDFLKEKYKNDLQKAILMLDLNVDEVKSFSDIKIPVEDEMNFIYTDMSAGKIGTIWREYQLFMADVFCKWTKRMKTWINQIVPGQMVTVGQDESIYTPRITNMEFGKEIDYTAQHPWWKNASLPLTVKTSKYPGKPLVLQETGVMYSENGDGARRRTEKEKALLIQRKFAYSFACKTAGTIQWLWNTNSYMANANESSIGAIRCDGTYKPEMEIFSKMSVFLEKAKSIMSDQTVNSEIVVVYPFSSIYSNRKYGMKGILNSSYILGGILKYDFDIVSEYELEILKDKKPAYILVPGAHLFETEKFYQLIKIIEETGSEVIFTGPISINEYGKYSPRMKQLQGNKESEIRTLQKFETIEYNGKEYAFLFGTEMSELGYAEEFSNEVMKTYAVGKGKLTCVGVPIELSENLGEAAAFYKSILNRKKDKYCITGKNTAGVYISKLYWEKGFGYCLINEGAKTAEYELKDYETDMTYTGEIPAGNVEMFVVDKTGNFIAIYENKKIQQSK